MEEVSNSNFQLFFAGFLVLFIYIAIILGKWNMVEQRVRLFLFEMKI